jgi:diaminopimelate decarboxylase
MTASTAPRLDDTRLKEAAERFGTPLYVYHSERIAWQYERLRTAFAGSPVRFFYACKSLTNVNILRYIRTLGAGLDCVSINEVRLGLHTGFRPDEIQFTPNSVGFHEYEEAHDLGVHVNIDSLEMLRRFGKRYGNAYPVCIRLNPHILAGGNLKISTGHEDSKFGISIRQIDEVIRVVEETGLDVEGLHVHTGSDITDVEVFLDGLKVLLGLSERFPNLRYLDLGSGFKVPYKEGDKQTDIAELGRRFGQEIENHRHVTGRNLEYWFEPGKFLVSQCGYLVVKANQVKHTPARVFVGVDSGFNHLIRPMFYDAYHHITNITNPSGPLNTYTVVGNICETDTFAWDRALNEVREDDLLVFHNAGAYGFEMSSRFNSRFRPAEVLVKDGQAILIRKREDFDDLLRGQVEVL